MLPLHGMMVQTVTAPEAQYIVELVRAFGVGFTLLIVVIAVIATGSWQALTAFISRRVTAAAQEQVDRRVRDHQTTLAKEIEAYRAQLALSADSARLTFQRQLQEFTLYAAKRYEVYSELFKHMLYAEGALASFYGVRSERGFQHESREEIEELMAERHLPAGLREEVFELFDAGNRQKFATRLRDILQLVERGEAVQKYWEAKNYFLVHELFLSEDALPVVEKAFDVMHDMVGVVRFPEPGTGRDGLAIKKAMRSAVDEVRGVMRCDLQRSDFAPKRSTDEASGISEVAI